jgi:hypothetical protein
MPPIRIWPTAPVRGILQLTQALMYPPFDGGTENFQPSNLEVTTIDVGNPATNVVPAKATASFNIRFNDTWTADSLQQEIIARLDAAASDGVLRPGRPPCPLRYRLGERPSHVFLTRNNALIASLSAAIESVTGASRSCRRRAVRRMRASSRIIARWSNSALSGRPCTWSTSASRSPISSPDGQIYETFISALVRECRDLKKSNTTWPASGC